MNFIEIGSEKNINYLKEKLELIDITKIPIFEDEIAKKNNKIETFITKEVNKKEFLNIIKNLK